MEHPELSIGEDAVCGWALVKGVVYDKKKRTFISVKIAAMSLNLFGTERAL